MAMSARTISPISRNNPYPRSIRKFQMLWSILWTMPGLCITLSRNATNRGKITNITLTRLNLSKISGAYLLCVRLFSHKFIIFNWNYFQHIILPSELKIGTDFSLFKDGILPMWEDKANKNGGRWIIALNKNQKPELDRYWIEAVSRFWDP